MHRTSKPQVDKLQQQKTISGVTSTKRKLRLNRAHTHRNRDRDSWERGKRSGEWFRVFKCTVSLSLYFCVIVWFDNCMTEQLYRSSTKVISECISSYMTRMQHTCCRVCMFILTCMNSMAVKTVKAFGFNFNVPHGFISLNGINTVLEWKMHVPNSMKDMWWCFQRNNTGFAPVSKTRANLCHDASTVMFACACYFN